ncbi:MAG: response regulator, partial [Alphaproteobacteria bacterium]
MAEEILIVDDEEDIRVLMSGVLQDEGHETREAANSEGALEQIAARRPNLVILDIWLEGSRLDGMELLHIIRREHPGLPVVMISGHGSIEMAVQAIKIGAYDYIEKPFKTDRLILVVARALETARLRRENRELRLRAGPESEMVGQVPAIVQLRQLVDKVAPTGSRVLIRGAAGSGKEVAARMIHARSHRAD